MSKHARRNEKDKVEITAEGTLSSEFATDTTQKVRGVIDVRRGTMVNPIEVIWMAYFRRLGEFEGGDFANAFIEDYLNLKMSVDGWFTNKRIQFTAASKGAPGVGELFKKPGWVQRNISQRDWERKAREEGKTIVE